MACSADCSLGAGGPSTRPRRTVRCSAAHGRAQARAASAAFGQLVGIQCMKTGSLLHNTRGWQRQRMLEGISGTERRLQRSRRGLARTTRFLHRSTGAHIALLHTVSRLACSHVILNGTLAKMRWQYCAESGCRTDQGRSHRAISTSSRICAQICASCIRRKDNVWKNLGTLHTQHV